MIRNFLLLVVVLFFLQNCGYSPIYLEKNNENFNFHIVEIKGNEEMNKIVLNKIERFSKGSGKEKVDLKIYTSYSKNILTKNKEGKATTYSLTKKIEFETTNTSKPQSYIFEQKTKTSSMISEFELKKYERTIQNNFINLKIEELIYKLHNLR